MELPKNIKQIGESDRHCKIYVEDYCVSYMKQMNQLALNKEMAVSLYGLRKAEGDVTYLFVYGTAKLDFLQREVRHLSQAQYQEIEKLRRKYFKELEFLGYCLLNGEMIEGVYICEQDICRYVPGYAQFYEKNDSMLAYMLETRGTEADPEVVDSGKYDKVKRRQEERRATRNQEQVNRKTPVAVVPSHSIRRMRVATVAVFGLLCLIGLSALKDSQGAEELQVAARQAMSSITEQKIPDAEERTGNQKESSNTLIAEDKLTEALQQENLSDTTKETQSGTVPSEGTEAWDQTIEVAPTPETSQALGSDSTVTTAQVQETTADVSISQAQEATEATATSQTQEVSATAITPEVQEAVSAEPVSYIIKEGDTLIGIALRTYGSEKRVTEICALNNISNPDEIKIGQKILLP